MSWNFSVWRVVTLNTDPACIEALTTGRIKLFLYTAFVHYKIVMFHFVKIVHVVFNSPGKLVPGEHPSYVKDPACIQTCESNASLY